MSNCAPNVLNALYTRHLADFPSPITALPSDPPYLYTPSMYVHFQAAFHEHYQDDSWKTNKSVRRVEQIEESCALDEYSPSLISSHIKTEIAPTMPKKARLIQAFVRPVDNYIVADHYRAFSHALVTVTSVPRWHLGMYTHVRSACGLNRRDITLQIAEWLSEAPLGPNTIFIDDVSNMDGSVQMPHLWAQQELYEHLSSAMADHHLATFRYRGTVMQSRMADADGSISYVARGRVKSGAQDTSSGQTTRRIDGIVRCFAGLGVRAIRGFVFGDDVWILVEGTPPPLDLVATTQAAYGWRTKGCYCSDLESSQFLSCGFAHTDCSIHMFPLIGRQLAKLFWTWRNIPNQHRRVRYVNAIAESFMPVYQGFPFLLEWLRWHIRPLGDRRQYAVPDRVTPNHPDSPVHWREHVWHRYGLPMPPAADFAAIHSARKDQVHLLYSEWAQAVMLRDLTDPGEYADSNQLVCADPARRPAGE